VRETLSRKPSITDELHLLSLVKPQLNDSKPHSTKMENFFQITPQGASPHTLRLSGSSRTSSTPNDTTRESPPEAHVAKPDDGHVKKRGRKGHSKSRTGCFSCKRARIKARHYILHMQDLQLMQKSSARKIDHRVTIVHTEDCNANGPRFRSTKSG
jgi:hypothetical protein